MRNKLSEQIEILIKNLELLNAPVLKLLNLPQNESKLTSFFNKHFPGIPVHEDIRDVFLWHNGTKIDYESPSYRFYLFADFFLNSIEKIEEIMESNEPFLKLKEYGFLPLFSTGNGEYLTLNLKDYINNPDKTPMYYLTVGDPLLELYTSMYDSFYHMFVSVNECFKQGVSFMDDTGLIDFDFKKYAKISKEMNPNSEFWRG